MLLEKYNKMNSGIFGLATDHQRQFLTESCHKLFFIYKDCGIRQAHRKGKLCDRLVLHDQRTFTSGKGFYFSVEDRMLGGSLRRNGVGRGVSSKTYDKVCAHYIIIYWSVFRYK